MIKTLTGSAVLALTILAPLAGYAATDKAPCGSFQKSADNSWRVIVPVKIETDKGSAMLSPGTTIKPGTHVAGVDIYAALQRSCH